MSAPLLSVEGVSKGSDSRGKRVLALDSVDLAVAEGEFVTIVGPSGCGKSTLLNLIVGLVRPSAGRILFRDRPVTGITSAIGYVTQRDNLLPWRTLVENVEIALELRGIPRDERRRRATGLIERVGLHGFEDHYPHELSGGMRQRANIARTLIYDPALILMDNHGFLVYYERLDDTQTASPHIAGEKARTAAMFRRPSKALEDASKARVAVLGLPGATPVTGGLPIVVGGKIVGGIGVSGVTSEQDEQVARAGLEGLK